MDSRPYTVGQGVKQGAISSPPLYKLYINDLVQSLTESPMAFTIGATSVGAPACADDVLMLAVDHPALDAMFNFSHEYSGDHEYELHPVKSCWSEMVKPSGMSHAEKPCHLGDDPVEHVPSFTHLGLEWEAGKSAPDVTPRIKVARATAYSMMGTGLHGLNGLDPPASLKLITTYVTPRLLHGLEATVLPSKSLAALDAYYRGLLRQIQNLPPRSPIEAIYILLGTLPIEAILHKRILSLFGAISRLGHSHPLHQIATRQMAVRDPQSSSWFSQIQRLGMKYDIDVHSALQQDWPKDAWKSHVKKMVDSYWLIKLLSADKKSVKSIIPHPHWINGPHPLWMACRGRPHHTKAAAIRAKMLIGQFATQEYLHRIGKGESLCLMCCRKTETISHIIAECENLQPTRQENITRLQEMFRAEGLPEPHTPREITEAVLNGGVYTVSSLGGHSTT